MRAPDSDDIFIITYSKWKVWGYTCLCWLLACLPLFVILLFAWPAITGEGTLEAPLTLLMFFIPMFLLFALMPFIFLSRLNKPVAILSREGYSGMKNLRDVSFPWSPDTIRYGVKGNTVLANPNNTQSRASKLWGGIKAAAIIHNGFAQQNRQDVLDAIDRLSPYAVKHTTHWGSSKH